MEILDGSYAVLIDVLDNGLNFNVALKHYESANQISGKEKNEISIVVGCVLRHYFIFKDLVAKYFGELSTKSEVALFILMAQLRFLTEHVDQEGVIKFTTDKLQENNVSYDQKTFDSFLDYIKNSPTLIPLDVANDSLDYIYYRFNIPVPIVKMWQKYLGKNQTYRVLKTFSKSAQKFYMINHLKISDEEFDKKYGEALLRVENHPNMVTPNLEYKSKDKLTQAVNNYEIFSFTLGLDELISSLNIDPLSSIAVQDDGLSTLYIGLSNALSNQQNKIDVMTDNGSEYYKITKSLKSYGITNMRFYHASPSSFITCISEPVDYFILAPRSSNFELLRLSPDYSIHFKTSSLDELILNERASLDEASKLLKEGGKLVYAISTISSKESHGLIKSFLNDNPDFTLLVEKQHLPTDEEKCSLYYAILQKKE
ncbi:MAG: hypothetical protein LUD22_00785 [Coprobacillus sp.]|nr:hypothetical protein [Coprobacillus sp.]